MCRARTCASCTAAPLVPAALYYIAAFAQADLEAARNRIAPLPEDRIPPLRQVLKEGWFFPLPFVVLVLALFHWNRTPEESALWAAATIVVVSLVFGHQGRRISVRDIIEAAKSTGRSSVDIVIIGAMAGMVIGLIDVSGLGFGVTFLLVQIGEGNLVGLMLLTAIICIIVGMGMPTAALYILVATLVAPPLVKVGVDPLAAHLFVLYFGLMSMITPPVALAAYAASNLAGSSPIETALTAIRLAWPAYVVPFMFALAPTLILKGGALEVSVAVSTAAVGIWLASAGFLGYFFRPMETLPRLGFVVGGLALLVPAGAFQGALYLDLARRGPGHRIRRLGVCGDSPKLVRGRRILVEPRVGTVRRPGSRAACGGSTRHGGERDGQGARRDSGVLDLGRVLGGPITGMLLAESGGGGRQDRAPRRRRPIPVPIRPVSTPST